MRAYARGETLHAHREDPDVTKLRSAPWRSEPYAVPQDVEAVPGMLTYWEKRMLYYLGLEFFSDKGAIVELGPFLGGSTICLAAALDARDFAKPIIHTYDLFRLSSFERDKYFSQGAPPDDRTRHIFDAHLRAYSHLLRVYEGDILSFPWEDGPIEILFVDAAKSYRVFDHVTSSFFPALIPGRSIVVLQDYIFDRSGPWHHVVMEKLADYFDYVADTEQNSAVFALKEAIPAEVLARAQWEAIPLEEKDLLMERAIEKLDTEDKQEQVRGAQRILQQRLDMQSGARYHEIGSGQPPPKTRPGDPGAMQRRIPPASTRGLDFSDFTILLSRQRSGTNAFRSALATHPDLFCFNEVFNLGDKDSDNEFLRNTNFFNFLEAYGAGDLQRILPDRHEALFLDFLEFLRCFSPKRQLVVDVKYNTLHFLAKPWAEIVTVPYLLDLIVEHRLRVLHLTRMNYLRQGISSLKAWSSGRYSVFPGQERPDDSQVFVGRGWLTTLLEKRSTEDAMIVKRFRDYPLYRSYDYAQIFRTSTEEPAPEVRRELAEWLGVPDSFGRIADFQKQSSLPLSQTISNYDEVVALLKDTQYAYCLVDEPLYQGRQAESAAVVAS